MPQLRWTASLELLGSRKELRNNSSVRGWLFKLFWLNQLGRCDGFPVLTEEDLVVLSRIKSCPQEEAPSLLLLSDLECTKRD